jgi:DUF971 family protein
MMPKKVKQVSPTELAVEWDDGHAGRHLMQTLRKQCPCASCKTDVTPDQGRTLFPILTPGQNELRAVQAVGNYALQLTWGDGHQTGIYSYEYLRELCECDECMERT